MILPRNTFRANLFLVLCVTALLVNIQPGYGKTRWSSLHIVPDADLLGTGELTVGFDGCLVKDTADNLLVRPSFPINFGITEWINVELGYSGGMTLGLKGRILGETGRIWPSIAIGVHNLISNKEVNYFAVDSADNMTGEVYLAISKGIDPIKTRFHLGIQSIPASENDKITPYFAVEKYFGFGLYASLEFYMRNQEPVLALFANWRFWRNRFEISGGAVDLKSMFLDENNKFAVSLTPANSGVFAKPCFWIGLRFHGRFGIGSNKGLTGLEDRLRRQDEEIAKLQKEVAALSNRVKVTTVGLDSVQHSVGTLVDSIANDPRKLKNIIYSKLITLRTLYTAEPFDPEKVKLATRELVGFREKAVPSLIDFVLDKKMDRYIRMYSITILGEIGNTSYSDVLLDELTRTNDPDIKIEILIALGKLKETRAMYLMEQLANSPNDAVALTAQEVLFRLSKTTGAKISPDMKMRHVPINENETVQKAKDRKGQDTIITKYVDTTQTRNTKVKKENSVSRPSLAEDTAAVKANEIFPLKGMSKERIDSVKTVQTKEKSPPKDTNAGKQESKQEKKADNLADTSEQSAVRADSSSKDSATAGTQEIKSQEQKKEAADTKAQTKDKNKEKKDKKKEKTGDKQTRKEKVKNEKDW